MVSFRKCFSQTHSDGGGGELRHGGSLCGVSPFCRPAVAATRNQIHHDIWLWKNADSTNGIKVTRIIRFHPITHFRNGISDEFLLFT